MDVRPDPDRLLARVTAEEADTRRGKLKVFLGAAPGVGKTYAMLGAARELRKQGADVVVGIVETHGRQDTAALLEGLEVLPRRRLEYRGRTLEELDLDALLDRRPAVALIDELAHTNVPGSRHARRWQDLEELLDAGIDVYTTVNVQHLESLNDVVAQITGIRVRETVPDGFLDRMRDLVLIDLPPRALIERLRQGKVYVAERAQAALDRFFSRSNLSALRELAMQAAADRIDADVHDDLGHGGPGVRRRVLLAVDGHAHTEYLVRVARRFAARQQAPWIVAYVETDSPARTDGTKLQAAFELAGRLGGETVILRGASVADELLSYASRHGVSSILIGRTRERPLARMFGRTITQRILTRGARFELTIVSTPVARRRSRRLLGGDLSWPQRLGEYAEASLVMVVATALSGLLERWLPLASLALVFLCGVLITAVRSRTFVAVYAALASFAAYNFFFTEPRWTFHIASFADIVAVFAFLIAALVCGQLAGRQHEQVVMLRAANEHARVLQSLGERLVTAVDAAQVFQAGCEALATALGCEAVILRRDDEAGPLRRASAQPASVSLRANDEAAADWVAAHGQPAGRHTGTLSASAWWFVPLLVERGCMGAVGLRFPAAQAVLTGEQRQLAEAIVQQTALAADRTRLAANLESARVEGETERLRTALLSSVSHDLRTPLAAVIGAASSLSINGDVMTNSERHALVAEIRGEGERLDRYIQNLLDMTHLGSGPMKLRRDWVGLDEILGAAQVRLRKSFPALAVTTTLAPGLPPLYVHPALIEQALFNILENAARVSPAGVLVRAERAETKLRIDIVDRGPGMPEAERRRIFDAFDTSRMSGLGLIIVRGLIGAHGGKVEALAGDGGIGTTVRVTLPLPEPPSSEREAGT